MATDEDDPFQLDKLANELARREKAHLVHPVNGVGSGTESSIEEGPAHDLPQLLPLSHDHPLLNENIPFNVDDFLMTRPNTSLLDLRAELRGYLGNLKEELVQLINEDYADFISLRTDLRGEGPRLQQLLGPIHVLQSETETSQAELIQIKTSFEGKLKERSRLREEKALLHLLLKISDLVERLETMLRISSPKDPTRATIDYAGLGIRETNDNLDSNHLETSYGDPDTQRSSAVRVKFLARVAAEFNQLLYHTAKARERNCVYVEELRKRITDIEDTLFRDLDIIFSASLAGATSGSSSVKAVADLTECLRIYDSLDKWDVAEDVIRRDVVQPFIRKTITSGALSTPVSPLVPRTILAETLPNSESKNPSMLTVDSPFAPFTPRQYPRTPGRSLVTSLQSSTSSAIISHTTNGFPSFTDQIHSEDPLTQILGNVLRFIERDLRIPIEITERINSNRTHKSHKGRDKSFSTPAVGRKLSSTGKEDTTEVGFDIMARVVWAETGRALIDQLGPIIFAAGRPDEFQKNYTILHDFITALEFASPSAEAVVNIRCHRICKAFERRWQLQVYFQLRWKEIIGNLEESLSRPPFVGTSQGVSGSFKTSQAEAVVTALSTCWSSSVYIPELVHRFWRLSLQIVSRFATWVGDNLPPRRNPDSVQEKKNTADLAAQDDIHLRTSSFIISDLLTVKARALDIFSQTICILLPSTLEDDERAPEEVFNDTLSALTSIIPPLSDEIVSILCARCQDPLQFVRSIPTQFRAMSSRNLDLPQEPSYFVPNILKPLKEFFLEDGAPAASLRGTYGPVWAEEIFKSIVLKYSSYLIGMKKTYDSIRRYKKGKQSAFMLFGSSPRNQQIDEEGHEEARIRAQMVLDVEALGKDASSLNSLINIDASAEYRELRELAARDDVTLVSS